MEWDSTKSLGYAYSALWFKVSLEPGAQEDQILAIDAPYLDSILAFEVYPISGQERRVVKHSWGDRYPYSQRKIAHPAYLLPLSQHDRPSTLYFYVENQGPMSLPVRIWEPSQLLLSDRMTVMAHSLATGALAFAILLNGFLYASLRRSEYLWYVAAICSALLVQFVLSGTSMQLLWPKFPFLNQMFSIYLVLATSFCLCFCTAFLDIGGWAKQFLHWAAFLLSAVVIATFLIAGPREASMIGVIMTLSAVLLTLVTAVVAYIKSMPFSGFFLLSLLPPALGGVVMFAKTFGIALDTPAANSALLLGFAANAFILNYALGQRLNRQAQERIATQGQLLDEQNRRLELESNLVEMMSYHPATGLLNRTALGLKISELLKHSRSGVQLWCIEIGQYRFIECKLGGEGSKLFLEALSNWLCDLLHSRFGPALLQLTPAGTERANEWSPLHVLGSPDTDTLAFAVHADSEVAAEDAQWLLTLLSIPFQFAGSYWALEPRLGTASCKSASDRVSGECLFTHCSVALALCTPYQRWFDYAVHAEAQGFDSADFSWDIEGAIARKEINLHYQPKIDVISGALTGFETLLRWQHPQLGFLNPELVVGRAESTGLINQLTLAILRESCNFLKNLTRCCGNDLRLAINISPFDLMSPSFVPDVFQVLEEEEVEPSRFIFEITESKTLESLETVKVTLAELQEAGIQISLDDFGTGFSSLYILHELPLNELKLDRSLLQDILSSQHRQTTMQSVVQIGQGLKLSIVVEGVEDEPVLRWLRSLGSTLAQGYGIARPMPAEAALEWATTRAANTS